MREHCGYSRIGSPDLTGFAVFVKGNLPPSFICAGAANWY